MHALDHSSDLRLLLAKQWLQTLPLMHTLQLNLDSLEPASNDASFRRYFRLNGLDTTYILMDAPPNLENIQPFIDVTKLFMKQDVCVPSIFAYSLEHGFILLSDLGKTTYLSYIQNLDENNKEFKLNDLYKHASNALIKIQSFNRCEALPAYSAEKLKQEMYLFNEWYVLKHLGKTLTQTEILDLEKIYTKIIANNLAQQQVYVHRDYHCRNLMHLEDGVGILDYQDAVYGPITYDLVSMWRDAYIEFDETQQINWLIDYWQTAKRQAFNLPDFDQFYMDYEWMGLQRHLKVLGIFARLYHRDGKDGYLKDLPLVLSYTQKVADRYDVFKPLARLLKRLHEV